MNVVTEDTINVQRAYNPRYAAIDATQRSLDALNNNKAFFANPKHQSVIEEVLDIVKDFFTMRKGVYVNHRVGRNRPFTVVKVAGCRWPNVPNSVADQKYRSPLAALGIVPVFSKHTNSYLFRIYG